MPAPKIVQRFGDLQIPARCPACGDMHKFFYLWLRHSGGYCCPSCDRIVTVDLVELDMAVLRLDTAIKSVRDVVNRVACTPATPAAPRPSTPPGPIDMQV